MESPKSACRHFLAVNQTPEWVSAWHRALEKPLCSCPVVTRLSTRATTKSCYLTPMQGKSRVSRQSISITCVYMVNARIIIMDVVEVCSLFIP